MHERGGLRGYDLGNLRIAVAETIDGNAGREIQILAIFHVIEITASTFAKHGRGPHIGRDHVRKLCGGQAISLGIRRRVGTF